MIKVVVLDSGLDSNSDIASKIGFSGGAEIYEEDGMIHFSSNSIDDTGHGTAVASYIHKLKNDIEIIPIKFMSKGYQATSDVMIAAFQYIYENIDCDIINISAGIVCCPNIEELRECCQRLIDKGIIIVSAYDNGGALSYPAAFEGVIGVDGQRRNWGKNRFKSIKDHNSDFVGAIKEVRLPFLNNEYEMTSGNSFLAPEFTVRIAEYMESGIRTFQDIVRELRKNAFEEIIAADEKFEEINYEIHQAIVFPFNKEMQSLARFSDLLSFHIAGFYDVKYSPNLGQNLELQDGSKYMISAIENVDWQGAFDTVILGHTSVLSDVVGRDYEKYIIELCIKYKKKLFSCCDIRPRLSQYKGYEKLEYYCPYVDPIKRSEFNKMCVVGTPVLGVVGTGGSQGKFTLQLGLRREFLKRGYHLAQLGTEPTALLFGMDCVYPMGHESAVYTKGFDAILVLNQMMRNMEKKEPDIIIFGNQSNSVPAHVGGPQDYPIVQHELILGCQADAYILCVSDDADLAYIKRTISYLEGVYPSEVIAIVISPLSIGARWSTINTTKKFLDQSTLEKFKKDIEHESKCPVLISSDTEEFYAKVTDLIEEYFGE